MGKCATKKRIKPTILCAGDLRELVDITLRELTESGFETSQPTEVFTSIRQQFCAIETVGFPNMGVSRFDGINIEDGATHLFWCEWDAGFPALENRNHFILWDDKRFKVLRMTNINERNTTVVVQTTERGEDTQEATKA